MFNHTPIIQVWLISGPHFSQKSLKKVSKSMQQLVLNHNVWWIYQEIQCSLHTFRSPSKWFQTPNYFYFQGVYHTHVNHLLNLITIAISPCVCQAFPAIFCVSLAGREFFVKLFGECSWNWNCCRVGRKGGGGQQDSCQLTSSFSSLSKGPQSTWMAEWVTGKLANWPTDKLTNCPIDRLGWSVAQIFEKAQKFAT